MSLSLNIVQTVCDGDCGLDVMCLMLGWTRSKQNRNVLRSEMAAFALKHIGNRAFIAMLRHVGELNAHLGLFELDSAGVELIEGDAQDSAQESHHGDGGAAIVVAGTLEATQRNFSDEEMQAVTWKCRLQKSSTEFINEMLNRLPGDCLKQTLKEYRARTIEAAKKHTPNNNSF